MDTAPRPLQRSCHSPLVLAGVQLRQSLLVPTLIGMCLATLWTISILLLLITILLRPSMTLLLPLLLPPRMIPPALSSLLIPVWVASTHDSSPRSLPLGKDLLHLQVSRLSRVSRTLCPPLPLQKAPVLEEQGVILGRRADLSRRTRTQAFHIRPRIARSHQTIQLL